MSVSVEVSLYKHPCESCRTPFWWVMWMRAVSPEPADWLQAWPGGQAEYFESSKDFSMPVIIDQPLAARAARKLLERVNLHGRVRQLLDRPADVRGASYNANRCPRCSHVADWYYFRGIIIEAAHAQRQLFISSATELVASEWAHLVDEQHSAWGF